MATTKLFVENGKLRIGNTYYSDVIFFLDESDQTKIGFLDKNRKIITINSVIMAGQ